MPRHKGHEAGVKNIRPIVRYLNECGVGYVTLYAFSTENWKRPIDEVSGLLRLLGEVIEPESRELHKNNVRIRHIGSLKGITLGLKKAINGAVNLTRENTGLTLGVAFNYGGRAEIIAAARRLIADGVPPRNVDEKLFRQYLYAADFPDVDMIIRTGGELRISNFLIWQTAYSEYYFTPVLWPDFNEASMKKALSAYTRRQRRFGSL